MFAVKKKYTNGTAIRKNVVFLHNKFRISAQKIFDFGTITIVSDFQAQCKWKVYIDLFALTGQTECAVSLSHFVCVCFLQFHVIIMPLHIVQAGSGQAFVSFVSKKRCTKYTAINNVYMCTNALCSVLGAEERQSEREYKAWECDVFTFYGKSRHTYNVFEWICHRISFPLCTTDEYAIEVDVVNYKSHRVWWYTFCVISSLCCCLFFRIMPSEYIFHIERFHMQTFEFQTFLLCDHIFSIFFAALFRNKATRFFHIYETTSDGWISESFVCNMKLHSFRLHLIECHCASFHFALNSQNPVTYGYITCIHSLHHQSHLNCVWIFCKCHQIQMGDLLASPNQKEQYHLSNGYFLFIIGFSISIFDLCVLCPLHTNMYAYMCTCRWLNLFDSVR